MLHEILLLQLTQWFNKTVDLINIRDIVMGFGLFLSNGTSNSLRDFVQEREHDLICLSITNTENKVHRRKIKVFQDITNCGCLVNRGWSKLQCLITKYNLINTKKRQLLNFSLFLYYFKKKKLTERAIWLNNFSKLTCNSVACHEPNSGSALR